MVRCRSPRSDAEPPGPTRGLRVTWLPNGGGPSASGPACHNQPAIVGGLRHIWAQKGLRRDSRAPRACALRRSFSRPPPVAQTAAFAVPLKNASRAALIASACVAGIPAGKPGKAFSFQCSFFDAKQFTLLVRFAPGRLPVRQAICGALLGHEKPDPLLQRPKYSGSWLFLL